VRIVLMPEHSALRDVPSPAADAALAGALALAGGDRLLPVLDLTALLDDELFFDYSHLNVRGRERLSQLLPGLLP
jgi:hypothetical protein